MLIHQTIYATETILREVFMELSSEKTIKMTFCNKKPVSTKISINEKQFRVLKNIILVTYGLSPKNLLYLEKFLNSNRSMGTIIQRWDKIYPHKILTRLILCNSSEAKTLWETDLSRVTASEMKFVSCLIAGHANWDRKENRKTLFRNKVLDNILKIQIHKAVITIFYVGEKKKMMPHEDRYLKKKKTLYLTPMQHFWYSSTSSALQSIGVNFDSFLSTPGIRLPINST